MSSWKEIYKSTGYLTLEQLGNKVITGEVLQCEPNTRTFKGNTTTRLEINVSGCDTNIILNQDSCKSLASVYGDDYDDWVGKIVKVAKGKVKFGKGTVPAIIVSPATKAKGR